MFVNIGGRIYFSDTSTRFTPALWGSTFETSIMEILKQSSTGRVLEYDPARKNTRIVDRGLSFTNGVAFYRGEQSLHAEKLGWLAR